MKKKLLFLPLFLVLASCTPSEQKEPLKPLIEFDDENIVFTAPFISDEHIGYVDANVNNAERLDSVFKTLKELRPNGFDAVLSTGDQTQNGKAEEVSTFMGVYNDNFSLDDSPFIFAHGNHDTYWSGCMTTTEFYDAYGSDVYKYDVDELGAKLGNRHVVVNGINFLTLQVKTFMPNYNDFTDQTMTWLDQKLTSLYQENPNRPVFVLCHSPAYQTVFGSYPEQSTGDWGASRQLNVMLKDYPNVILLSGHTHYGITDERNIFQKDFTCIQGGSICDLDLDERYPNVTDLPNERDYSFGQIIEIDKFFNTRVTRFDFKQKSQIKEPWIIPCPKEDNSHLYKYTDEYRIQNNVNPWMIEGGEFTVTKNETNNIVLTFDAFKDDDMVFAYTLYIFMDEVDDVEWIDYEEAILEYTMMVDWYNYPLPQEGKITKVLSTKMNSVYSFVLVAEDSFGGKTAILPTNR